MPWSDIDFENTLITGMITGGTERSSTVSFADYLNTFSRALDEKLNMILQSSTDQLPPELPELEFISGEIRSSLFWQKYRELLEGYFYIWNSSNWYDPAVINDRLNDDNYLIEESYIRTLIGDEVFDILADPFAYPAYKIFTADVLQGCYNLYKELKIRSVGEVLFEDSSQQRKNVVARFREPKSVYFGSADGQGFTENDARDAYNDDLDLGLRQDSGNRLLNLSRLRSRNNNDTSFRFDSVMSHNNSTSYYYATDLNLNLLNIDYYIGKCSIAENYIELGDLNNNNPVLEDAYNNDYPAVGSSDISVDAIINPAIESQDNQRGTKKIFRISPDGEVPLLNMPGANKTRSAKFVVARPSGIFVDINNSSLEFST